VFGLIVRCELKSGSHGRFDELVAEVVRMARKQPQGLIAYSCHPVSGLADSRIFIELYEDHVAFVEFGRRPDIRRFVDARDALLAEAPRVDFVESPVGGALLYFGRT
jgi:quinol monooxygenase YgiN